AAALADDLADRPDERAIAVKIAGAVNRLNAVVGDVLSFSRELKVRPVRMEMVALIERAIESSGVASSGVRVRTQGADEALVTCDPGVSDQALANIIRNAGEASREAGADEIGVSASTSSIITSDGPRIPAMSIRVHDQVPGF